MVEFLDLLPILLALFSSVAFGFLLQCIKKKNSSSQLHGSMGWPICGETLAFLKPHRSNSLGSFLEQRCSRYGKVFKSHLLGSPTVISCDYRLNTYILQNERNLFPADYPTAMRNILGRASVIFVTGDSHKKLRTIIVGFINAAKFGTEFPQCVELHALSILKSWKDYKQVAFYEAAKRFTLNVMLKHLLSIKLDEPVSSKFYKNFEHFIKGFIAFPLRFPGTAYSNSLKARARLSSIVKEIIEERRKNNVMPAGEGDFLSAILSKQNLSDEERVNLVLDLMFGGFETTAKLLSLVVYFMGQAPHVLEMLKKEQQHIRESKRKEEGLSWQDYKKMKFTLHVIHEALRCGNVVKGLIRKAAQEVRHEELVIPAGWKVLPILSAGHLDAELHEDPFRFNPLRWDIESSIRENVTPFGGGPRVCPGADLAKMEAAFFLHHLVLNYRWKLTANDDHPIAYPYLEFSKGLLVDFEFIDNTSG